ncbi:MAG: hypothetical protein V9F01_11340 [Chitinophagaceae bacterium]
MHDNQTTAIINNLSDFISNSEALLLLTKDAIDVKARKLQHLNDTIKELIKDSFNVNHFESLYNEHKDVFKNQILYEHQFDYLFFNSIFINSYSLFEQYFSALGRICEELQISSIKISDIKGDGIIGTTRKYLNLVLKISSAAVTEQAWIDINEFRSIRNAIVHNENKLNCKKNIKNPIQVKGFSKIVQHNLTYNGDDISFVINKIAFLQDFNDTAKKYAIMVTKEIIDNYR